MKKILADALIVVFVLLIISASSQATRTNTQSGSPAEAFGALIGYLLLVAGLFYTARWRMKLSGHTYKVGRQTVAAIAFWYSLLAVLIGLATALTERNTFGLVFGAIMVLVWSSSAYGSKRWLRRLRAGEQVHAAITLPSEPVATPVGGAKDLDSHPGLLQGAFFKISAATTLALSVYIAFAARPFSFLFTDRSIDQTVIEESVVNVLCSSLDGRDSGGSGIILTADGSVITNSHVIPQNDGHLLTEEKGCLVILPNRENGQPQDIYWAKPIVISGLSDKYDLAYLRIYDVFTDDGGNKRGALPRTFPSIFAEGSHYDETCRLNESVKLGDPVRIFGYPQTSGGLNLTVTDGVVSSIDSDGMVLTSAKVDAGNSGGLAVNRKGCMVGIPTAVSQGKYQNLGIITPTEKVVEFSDAVSKLNDSSGSSGH